MNSTKLQKQQALCSADENAVNVPCLVSMAQEMGIMHVFLFEDDKLFYVDMVGQTKADYKQLCKEHGRRSEPTTQNKTAHCVVPKLHIMADE